MKDTTKKEGHTAIFDAKAFCLFASPPCKCGVHESPVGASSKHAHTEKHEKSHNAAQQSVVLSTSTRPKFLKVVTVQTGMDAKENLVTQEGLT